MPGGLPTFAEKLHNCFGSISADFGVGVGEGEAVEQQLAQGAHLADLLDQPCQLRVVREVERADPGQLAEGGGQVLEVVVRQVQALEVAQVAQGVWQFLEPVIIRDVDVMIKSSSSLIYLLCLR